MFLKSRHTQMRACRLPHVISMRAPAPTSSEPSSRTGVPCIVSKYQSRRPISSATSRTYFPSAVNSLFVMPGCLLAIGALRLFLAGLGALRIVVSRDFLGRIESGCHIDSDIDLLDLRGEHLLDNERWIVRAIVGIV